jgi:outer membrane protein assembly factor BamB
MPDQPPSTLWRRALARLDSAFQHLLAYAWANPGRAALAAGAILAAIVIGIVALYENVRRPPDVTNESAVFNPQETKVKLKTVNWPLYGYNRRRTRYLAAKGIKPPFKKLWKYGGRPLLEFPPSYANGKLFGVDNNGHVFAIDADNGKVLWKRRVGALNASSPTYSRHRLFVVTLSPGQVLALNEKTGKTEWKKELGSRSESAPIVVEKRVYFGDEAGTLYAVDRRNGHTIWTAQLCGSIKAAPAYQHGILFVGDYGGCMNAVNSHSGKIKWQSSSQGLGLGSVGRFYSTPAVAFGRVYSGNLDHRVYSFQADDGTLAWSHSTGGYVYSGPTVADTPTTAPTVYIGSIDGYLYALDAKDGETRWSHSVGGRVIASPSAVGNIVYVSTYSPKQIDGLKMRNGRQVFSFGSGGANSPVISDGHRLYLTGYSSITALDPLSKKQLRARAKAKKEKRQQAAQRKKQRQQQAGDKKQNAKNG